ncbi:MAG TPA: hypothetical protein VJ732_07125 [Bryobacteraceae bacterium]|nr:hypothetical protein [Bryobacteraceae bacterium]
MRKTLMDSEKQFDLGSWTGLQKAFAAVAGSCSAARARCLKQVRDSGMLDDLGLTWDEFCKDYAGLSRGHADHLIRQYDQFGDAYFHLSEIARVSSKAFQQIAGHVVSDNGAEALEIDGEKLALVPENAAKIRAAIQSLRNQVHRPPAPPRPPAGVIELQARVDALAADLAKAIAALQPLSEDERAALRALGGYAVNKFRNLARQLGVAV